nr:hemagglutinin repeat-containing protein [Janthinobacterium sp. B9-8]
MDFQTGKDIKVNGSAIAATQDVQLLAGNDVKITAGTNSSKDIHDKKESKSGLFSGGGFGFTYGKQEQQTHTDADGSIQSQNRSLVGSEQGKLTIKAGNAIQVTDSDLSALAGDMVIQGKQVTVDPGQDRHQSTETQTFKQSGITVAFSAPVLSVLQAAQTVASSAQQGSESKDSRVKALSVGTAALAAKNGIDAAKAAAADPSSVSVSITYGESKSESVTKTSSISHSGSTLNAGGDIQISAVGDKASQLNVLGSEINAKGNIKLKSDGDINLQSALDESEQHSKNSSSSWGAGVAITMGQGGGSYGVTANGSLSRGQADGKDTAQQNSHINAGKILTLESGNGTRVEGAVVSGNKIIADIGGDLKLASRQDTSQFDSKQSSVSASVTVGVGVSGSASISQDKMKSDYAAVQEQSGLFAGKDGFEIKVKKNTDLNGAVIASKSDDNTLSTGTLTQKDINNHAEYSASSIGIGGGFSMGGTEKKPEDGKAPGGDQAAASSGGKLYDAGPSGVTPTAPVALSAGDNGTSTTKSAIATAKITITDEAKQKELTGKTAAETIASLSRDTDGAQQQLANDFKPEKINELFSATKTFLQEGNTFMANRTAEADAAKKALDGTTASLKAEQAKPQDQQNQALIRQLKDQVISLDGQKTEADRWTPGGDYGRAMTALQAAVGGNVSGGATGLLQNASVAYLQSLGAEKIKAIANTFQEEGKETATSQNVRAALHAIASCAGAAVSASNCSSAAVGAASSVVINNVLSEIENTNADNMTASEKEKRKNLVGSIITGIVAATDGNAAAANNAAQIEMENNSLKLPQLKSFHAEYAACKPKDNCKAIEKKYQEIATKQLIEVSSLCASNLDVCRSKYGELMEKRSEIFAELEKMQKDLNLPSSMMYTLGALRMQESDAMAMLSSTTFAETMKQKWGVTPEQAALIVATISGVKSTAKSVLPSKPSVQDRENPLLADKSAELKANEVNKTPVGSCLTPPACFVAGTLVETSAGLKPIETFVGGELVWSRSDETGEYGFRPVLATKATSDQTIYHLQVRNSAGVEESLRTTAEHPFWIQDQGWLKASLLAADMVLLDRLNKPLTVISLSVESATETVFNIQVAEFQTYHVGEFGVWVHNAACCDLTNRYGAIPAKWVNADNKVEWMNPVSGKRELLPDGVSLGVDHILPQNYILKKIPDFSKLPPEVQKSLINDQINLQPITRSANSSKKSTVEWIDGGWKHFKGEPVHQSYKDFLLDAQRKMAIKIDVELIKRGLK